METYNNFIKNMYELMNNKVKLTKEEILNCREYSKKYSEFFEKTDKAQDAKAKEYHVFIGKLGELAYLKLFYQKISPIKNPGDKRDPGFDFIDINNLKIDVKTIDDSWKQRIYINIDYFYSDIIVLMYINLDRLLATYMGAITKDLFLKNKQFDFINRKYYVSKDLFTTIL